MIRKAKTGETEFIVTIFISENNINTTWFFECKYSSNSSDINWLSFNKQWNTSTWIDETTV